MKWESLVAFSTSASDPVDRFEAARRFAQVQAAKHERSRRAAYLPLELFAEPGWDILLELYAFELVSGAVNESDLADRINVPATTTGRWMKMLETAGLVKRKPDLSDSAQVIVSLSPKGYEALDAYFADLG